MRKIVISILCILFVACSNAEESQILNDVAVWSTAEDQLAQLDQFKDSSGRTWDFAGTIDGYNANVDAGRTEDNANVDRAETVMINLATGRIFRSESVQFDPDNTVKTSVPYSGSIGDSVKTEVNDFVTARIVSGSDDRTRATDSTSYPKRTIGTLELNNIGTGNFSQCTGTLVGPRHVLSAGHCFYANGKWKTDWTRREQYFQPGRNGLIPPWGGWKIGWVRLSPEWSQGRSNYSDYSMAILSTVRAGRTFNTPTRTFTGGESAGSVLGYMGMKAWSDAELLSRTFQLWGYPGLGDAAGPGQIIPGELWGDTGVLQSVRSDRMLYTEIDTTGGQSGSVLYTVESDGTYAAGVHAGSIGSRNRASRINQQRLAALISWKSSLGNLIFYQDQGPPATEPVRARGAMQYDLGGANTPLRNGYLRLTNTMRNGIQGWTNTSGLQFRDRGASGTNELNQDLIQSRHARTFEQPVDNGRWYALITFGDKSYRHDNMAVDAEGVRGLSGVTTQVGQFHNKFIAGTVSDGRFSLTFSDQGGSDQNWAATRIILQDDPFTGQRLTSADAIEFDLGGPSTPVFGGYQRLSPQKTVGSFSSAHSQNPWGWVSNANLDFRDRNSGNDINRDFIFSSQPATFEYPVENGDYEVLVTMGDAAHAHDNQAIDAEGVRVASNINTSIGENKNVGFTVSVTDGTLTLTFSDQGGSGPHWTVKRLNISGK